MVGASADSFSTEILSESQLTMELSTNHLGNLPSELILKIHLQLPYLDLVSLCLASKVHLIMAAEAFQGQRRHPSNALHEGYSQSSQPVSRDGSQTF